MLFYISHVKVNGYMFRGSNLAIFIFASLFNEDKSSRKEFALKGANSFLKELLLWNSFVIQGNKLEVTKVDPHYKNASKQRGVLTHLKADTF